MLDGLGPARPWLEQCLEASTKLAQPRVRMLPVPRGCTVNPIERRRDLQDLAPRLEKVVIENIRRIARFLHESFLPIASSSSWQNSPRHANLDASRRSSATTVGHDSAANRASRSGSALQKSRPTVSNRRRRVKRLDRLPRAKPQWTTEPVAKLG